MPRKNLTVGKFQAKIIFITFIPMVVLLGFMFLLLFVIYWSLTGIMLSQQSVPAITREIQQYCYAAVGVITLVFVGFLVWVYIESGKMVGAFERMIKELNAFDPDNPQKAVHARKGDTFAQDIAQRINEILENWIKGKPRP